MIEGRIYRDGEQQHNIIVDAEPHVMAKLRPIFDNAKTVYINGKFTHKPIIFSLNMSTAKDLLWIMSRYKLKCSVNLLREIKSLCEEYDNIRNKISNADKNSTYQVSPNALPLALPLRKHQIQFVNMFSSMKKMLLADKMGLGKTPSAIATLQEPESRPSLIVVPTHLCSQWEREIKRFLPGVTTHIIKGFKKYEVPTVDVLITSYNRLGPWQDVLVSDQFKFNTLIMDEVHELRHTLTEKRSVCKAISDKVKFCLGLSGTPIYNQGGEIWSVMDTIYPNCLGDRQSFLNEWCNWEKVREPAVLHSYLKSRGLFLRRTLEDVGMKFGEATKHVYTLDADMQKLQEIQNTAKMLALSVLSGNIESSGESAAEFDWRLRHATGVAKAKPVAEFVKMIAENGEKVLLAGWHRDCYDIWEKELKHLNPVFYTGTESTAQKDASVKKFIEGDSKVFVISLRSGAGLDGLQRVCNTVVFGELDWSPHVMDQVLARLDRDGQTKHVQAFYLTIPDGSDPFMMGIISKKRDQHDGLIEGKEGVGEVLNTDPTGKQRIQEMAKSYLKSIGEDIPEPVIYSYLMSDVSEALKKIRVPTTNEKEMQQVIATTLPSLVDGDVKIEREVSISKRSRLDFMVSRGDEKIAIECKINNTKRTEVYRQVRRYVKEGQVSSVIIFAPWFGISSFKVDNTPVLVVDTSVQAI